MTKNFKHTKIALTMDTSKMVGTILKSKADSKKLIPRLPRSITLGEERENLNLTDNDNL